MICLKTNCPLPPTSLMWEKNVWKILQYGPVDTRCLTENLSCAHDDIIIGDFDTPEKNIIGLDDSIAPEAVDLTKD
jgi:hypothetical protein